MGYNSHPKIMKKLFYSFIMLVAMSLTFVACEQKNPDDNKQEIKSNCELFVCQYSIDETGHAMYVFEFSTNGLDIVNAKGSGDYLVLMAYAKPGADGFPTENTYKLIPVLVAIVGGVLGVLIYLTSPEMIFNVDNLWIALGIGIISGFSATGTNQVVKQLFLKKEEIENAKE